MVKVAVVGCGHWGKNLVRNFDELGALAAISDTDWPRAAALSQELDVPALPFADILMNPGVDSVILATPAETHGSLALRCIDAGKDVFVEKPLALDIVEAERVKACAEERDRIVLVGHLLQYHPGFLKLKQLAANGDLGRIRYIHSNRLNLGKIRREENVFWSFAPHDLSMILALAGGLPDTVEATGHCYLHNEIADVTTTHLHFGNGINAHVFVSWLHPFKEQKLVVVGDAGMAVFDDGQPWSDKLVVYPHKVTWQNGAPQASKGDAILVSLEEAEPLKLECAHFLECITDHRRPRTDAEEGLNVLRVLDAAEQAMSCGHRIALKGTKATLPYHVHDSAFVESGCEIGLGTRVWHFSHILPGSRIGRDCVIGQNVVIGPDVTIGDRCKIQNNVSLYKGITLGDGVFCGPSAVFTNVNSPRAEVDRKDEFRPTSVGRGATIGANATIVCGHELGEYCFVAAGAVVTRDVAAHALVAGNPARQIGWVSHVGERLGDNLTCPRTGRLYSLTGDRRLVEVSLAEQVA